MRTRALGVLAIATLSCTCLLTWRRFADAQESSTWKTSALILEDLSIGNKSVRVWLGITNVGKAPKVICVRALWYSLHGENGLESGGTAQPLLTHSCSDGFGQQLLLPNATYLVRGELRVDAVARADHKMRLRVDLVESDPYTEQVVGETSATWLGTLAEASDAGKRARP